MIDQAVFTNMLRSMFNIDGHQLPELSNMDQSRFLVDPVRFFIRADDEQQDAIWREIMKRQKP